jgi:hypothetical protein
MPNTIIHGQTGSPTYWAWHAMLQRCRNPNHPNFKDYGGRGIKIDNRRWFRFVNFRTDMGDRPPGMMLDRRDNDKGYSKKNCRWATPKESANNRRPPRKCHVQGLTV